MADTFIKDAQDTGAAAAEAGERWVAMVTSGDTECMAVAFRQVGVGALLSAFGARTPKLFPSRANWPRLPDGPATPNRGLGGNPFKGKSPQQIDQMMRSKGFKPVGPDPASGKGSYLHPETGRKYYIDEGRVYGKKVEGPHVDVHRMRDGANLEKQKKRYFLDGDIQGGN